MVQIKAAEDSMKDEIMEIWLSVNLHAQSFIPDSYWKENYSVVEREYLPVSMNYVYEENGKIKGFISIMQGYFIGALFVANGCRSQGVGRALLTYCQKNRNKLMLGVYAQNESALRFYRSCGFEVISKQITTDVNELEYTMEWKKPVICYDVTKELLTAFVYPGDPVPKLEHVLTLENGDPCNLSQLVLGSHSGTHLDAPRHFYKTGRDVSEIDIDRLTGWCTVVTFSGIVEGDDLEPVLRVCRNRLLIKGEITLTLSAAKRISCYGIQLIGVEGMTVGSKEEQSDVHLTLLGKEVVIVESLDLSEVEDGDYRMTALPLKIAGCDGSPARVLLYSEE